MIVAYVNEYNYRKVLLNFRDVEYISSDALGALITLNNKLRELGCWLVLCHISPQIYEVFEILRLHRYFTISGEDPDADPPIITGH